MGGAGAALGGAGAAPAAAAGPRSAFSNQKLEKGSKIWGQRRRPRLAPDLLFIINFFVFFPRFMIIFLGFFPHFDEKKNLKRLKNLPSFPVPCRLVNQVPFLNLFFRFFFEKIDLIFDFFSKK